MKYFKNKNKCAVFVSEQALSPEAVIEITDILSNKEWFDM